MNSPYTPPTTSLVKEPSIGARTDAYGNPLPQLLETPRKCGAGWGISWLSTAFELFKQNFLLWIGIGATYFVILFVVGMIPVLGLLASLSSMIFIGGIIKGAATQAEGGELKFEHLFSGFKTHFMPLLILTLLYIVAFIIILIPLGIIAAVMFSAVLSDSSMQAMAAGSFDSSWIGMLLFLGFCFILMLPIIMSVWFAPALIVLHDIQPLESMKMSLRGCLKNIVPLLVCGLVVTLAFPIVVIFTLGLGILAVYPIFFILYYTSYRDVWTDQPVSG